MVLLPAVLATGQATVRACGMKERRSRVRSNETALHHFCLVLISQVMWVGAAPHWLHATSLPEVDLARVHQSHFTFLIDLNTVQQCSRNSGPPTTDGPRLSAGGIGRKSIAKIVSDSDRMKNTSRHVSAKTALLDWPSTESGRISSFHNFILVFFSIVPDYGLDDRATGVIVSTCSWGSVAIIYLPRCGLLRTR
jgi:hypothetical protein